MKDRLAVFILLLLAGCSTTKEKVKVGLNLSEGQVYYQTFQLNGMINQQGIQPVNLQMNTMVRYRFDVIKKDHSGYDMRVSFDRMLLEMTESGGQLEAVAYDTDVVDSNAMNKILRALIGESFRARMNADGSVANVHGIDAMFRRVLDKMGELEEEDKHEVSDLLNQEFGMNQLMQNMQFMASFPEDEIKVNDTWTDTIGLMGDIQVGFATLYTVKKITDDYILVDVKGHMDMEEMNSRPANDESISVNGDIAYEQQVDRKTGWTTSMDGHYKVSMQLRSMGTDIPSAMQFTIKGWSGK